MATLDKAMRKKLEDIVWKQIPRDCKSGAGARRCILISERGSPFPKKLSEVSDEHLHALVFRMAVPFKVAGIHGR